MRDFVSCMSKQNKANRTKDLILSERKKIVA